MIGHKLDGLQHAQQSYFDFEYCEDNTF
jgi:hypothetical protein